MVCRQTRKQLESEEPFNRSLGGYLGARSGARGTVSQEKWWKFYPLRLRSSLGKALGNILLGQEESQVCWRKEPDELFCLSCLSIILLQKYCLSLYFVFLCCHLSAGSIWGIGSFLGGSKANRVQWGWFTCQKRNIDIGITFTDLTHWDDGRQSSLSLCTSAASFNAVNLGTETESWGPAGVRHVSSAFFCISWGLLRQWDRWSGRWRFVFFSTVNFSLFLFLTPKNILNCPFLNYLCAVALCNFQHLFFSHFTFHKGIMHNKCRTCYLGILGLFKMLSAYTNLNNP